MRSYIRGMMAGGLMAAGLVMWLQRRSQRRRWMRLGAKAAAQAARSGRRILARAAH